jgi:hypothetical protein
MIRTFWQKPLCFQWLRVLWNGTTDDIDRVATSENQNIFAKGARQQIRKPGNFARRANQSTQMALARRSVQGRTASCYGEPLRLAEISVRQCLRHSLRSWPIAQSPINKQKQKTATAAEIAIRTCSSSVFFHQFRTAQFPFLRVIENQGRISEAASSTLIGDSRIQAGYRNAQRRSSGI